MISKKSIEDLEKSPVNIHGMYGKFFHQGIVYKGKVYKASLDLDNVHEGVLLEPVDEQYISRIEPLDSYILAAVCEALHEGNDQITLEIPFEISDNHFPI